VGLTAWQALFDHAKLAARQRVLINGAGGAVGGYAVQLAKKMHITKTGEHRCPTRSRLRRRKRPTLRGPQ
jgi:NADPH:quinone reductase-like Zn-dependent oxidoreductase